MKFLVQSVVFSGRRGFRRVAGALTMLAMLGAASAVLAAQEVILVLDNSGSMRTHDPQFLTRLAVREFVSGLDADASAGLLVFDDTARFVVPLTPLAAGASDQILSGLEQVDYSGQLTDSPSAMERAIYQLKTAGDPDADKFIVFMTDGIVDTGDSDRDLDKAQWLREDLAADAAAADIRIFGIAFTEDADFQLIQSLARRTHGDYYRAFGAEEIDGVFTNVMRAMAEPVTPPQPVAPVVTYLPAPLPIAAAPAPVQAPAAAPPPVAAPPPKATSLDELLSGPADSPSVAPAAPAPVIQPVTQVSTWLWVAVAAVAVLVIAVFGIALLLLRRNTSTEPEVDVPQAFLNDLNAVTGQVSIELGSLPLMVGRMAGTHTGQFQYVVIDDNAIGRQHAVIEYKNHAFWVDDQGSVNGTFLNGTRITTEMRLKHGDKLRFHKHEFEFVMPEMFGTGMTLFSATRLPTPATMADDGEDQTVMPDDPPTIPPVAEIR